jgi:hypothetical protein
MMRGAVTALAVAGLLTTTVVTTGCCKKGGSGFTDGKGGETSELVKIADAKVQFNAPAGWTKYTAGGGWTLFKPPDNTARLGFVTFDKPGESTARIGQIAGGLDLGEVKWTGDAKTETIGPNAFPSRSAKGTCKFTSTGVPCELWYATVNPGGSDQLLVVYAVNTTGTPTNKLNAEAAVRSLRKM